MRLGYFTMPLHPAHRPPAITLQEDREAIILADRLGFYDAFVGEHLTEPSENVTNSFIFLATLIHHTRNIKLATGTSNLSHSHPTLIAAHAAMFDHLAQGRFIFGVSPGALPSDAEALGMLGEDRNKLFAEAIDVILAIWERDAPYDIDFPGNRFKVSTAQTQNPEIGRGGMGVKAMDGAMRGGKLVASFPVEISDQIMLATSTGQSIRVPVEQISFRSRSAGGVKVFNVGADEEVVSVARVAEQGDD